MGDVSELFKRHFNLLHKGTANLKTVENRKEAHNNARKAKRDTLAYLRRNINEAQSPITPIPTERGGARNKRNEKSTNVGKDIAGTTARSNSEGINKRLELLHKWKTEKAKLKQQEKAKAKPLFKVCHVPSEMTSNLENANKLIKGKPIVPGSASKKSQFAAPDHKFKPPKGIKPIIFPTSATNVPVSSFLSTSTFPKMKGTPKQDRTKERYVFAAREPKEKDSKPNKENLKVIVKPIASRFNKDKEDGLIEEIRKKPVDNTIVNKKNKANLGSKKASVSNTTLEKSTPALPLRATRNNTKVEAEKTTKDKAPKQKTSKKIVGWNVRKTDIPKKTSDDDITSKITCRKTPKKSMAKDKEEKELEPKKVNVSADTISTLDGIDEGCTKKAARKSNIPSEKGSDNIHPSAQTVDSHFPASSNSSTDYSVDYNNCSSTEPSAVSVSEYKTPPPVYVSPFVTISRGKNSARKEYRIRSSQGACEFDNDTPEVKKILTAHTSPKAGAAYFKRKLDIEVARITKLCEDWNEHLKNPDLPEEANSSIDVALGQSRLLITKKLQQFRGLILQCETENYEVKPVTCEDLHGFWDMIYMQVNDLDKRFENLQKLKENNWEEILPPKVVPVKRTRGRPKKAQPKSKIAHMIQEARKNKTSQNADVLINGLDYPKILQTPPKETLLEEFNSSRRSSRVSVLKEHKSRCSSSPGLTMMKISQSIKQGDGLTPARSILKSDGYKSTGKKSVVFMDNIEASSNSVPLSKTNLFNGIDKENISDNLISFSPVPLTPRRSRRISKLKM